PNLGRSFPAGNTVRCSSENGSGAKSALSLGGRANAPGNSDTVGHRQRANQLPARVLPTLTLPDPRIPPNRPSSTPGACAGFAHRPLSRNRDATGASFARQTTGPTTALWIAAAAIQSAVVGPVVCRAKEAPVASLFLESGRWANPAHAPGVDEGLFGGILGSGSVNVGRTLAGSRLARWRCRTVSLLPGAFARTPKEGADVAPEPFPLEYRTVFPAGKDRPGFGSLRGAQLARVSPSLDPGRLGVSVCHGRLPAR